MGRGKLLAFIVSVAGAMATSKEGWGLRNITASKISSRSPAPA